MAKHKLTNTQIADALRGGSIPPEFLLGYGVISTVPDASVQALKLTRLWGREGLPAELVPKADRNPVHAFQVACRSVETRRRNGGERETEVKVDEVLESPTECLYQITRLVRDKAHRVIDHPKAMTLVFDKQTHEITVKPLEREAYRLLKGLEDAIRRHYEANVDKVTGYKVREAIRTLLKMQGATSLRRTGSVYFVPAGARELLESVRNVLDKLYDHEDASLFMLPVPNGEYERKMVEDQFTMTASTEIDELLADVVNYRKKGNTVRMDKLDNMVKRRSELAHVKGQYEGLLQTELEMVASKIDLLDESLEALMEAKYAA